MHINIEANSIQELDEILARLGGKQTAAAAPKAEVERVTPKTPEKTAAASKTETPKEETAAPSSDKAEISYAKDIAPRVLKLAEKKGRQVAIDTMAKFGVEKAPQLTAAQYPDFIKAVDAAMAAE